MTNTQSTLLIPPDCRKNVPLALLFAGNGNPDIVSTQSGIYNYTHNFYNIGSWSDKEIKNIRQHWMPRAKENYLLVIFDTRAFGSVALL